MINDNIVLKKLNILNSFLSNYNNRNTSIPNNGELIYRCVNKNCPSHIKRKDKFCVNILKESAHCWVCGIKFNNLNIVVKKFGNKFFDNWKLFSKNKFKPIIPEEEPISYFDDLFLKTKSIENLKENHAARLYLKSRYISLEKAKKFNISYVDFLNVSGKTIKNFICIPSHSENGMDYLFFRSILTNYKLNTKAKKTNIIFNDLFINWKKPIFLTEGVFDALRLFDYDEQAIPILGSSVSQESNIFKKILKIKPKIIVALDPDAIQSQLKILDLFYKWNVDVYSMELNRNDIAASTEEEIIYALKNIKKFNNTYKNLKRLQI